MLMFLGPAAKRRRLMEQDLVYLSSGPNGKGKRIGKQLEQEAGRVSSTPKTIGGVTGNNPVMFEFCDTTMMQARSAWNCNRPGCNLWVHFVDLW